jgi:MSHA biogenesis protein MshK
MDDGMSDRMAFATGGLILLCVATATAAQALGDPTVPPYAYGAAVSASGRGATGPALQSILLSPVRRLALIDGRMVRIGDQVGGARVIAIDIDSVKLRRGDGISVMKLLPDVGKDGTKPAPVFSGDPESGQEDDSR